MSLQGYGDVFLGSGRGAPRTLLKGADQALTESS